MSVVGSPLARPIEAWERAAVRDGHSDKHYLIAGIPVRLRFAGEALVTRLSRALAHLEVADVTDPVDIYIGDDHTAGEQLPLDRFGEIGMYRLMAADRSRAATAHYNASDGTFCALDRDGREGFFWVQDPPNLPSWEDGAPLRVLFHWLTTTPDRQQVHSGAVGIEGRGVLVVGKGGSGKSTSCLASALAGMQYAGDDYAIVAGDELKVHSLYNTAKLEVSQLECFPRVQEAVANRDRLDREKAVMFVNEIAPERVVSELDIVAVLVPRVRGGDTTEVVPLPRPEAFKALALSTISQLPGDGQTALGVMSKVVAASDCYRLELGDDIASIPAAIRSLLESG